MHPHDIAHEKQLILNLLKNVTDPEIPVLTIQDMGILREINLQRSETGQLSGEVIITPTYSGCPAMDAITQNIRMELLAHGYKNIAVKQVLSPAWTTDWMTEEGRQKLKEYGIAPPVHTAQVCSNDLFSPNVAVQCPQCNSFNTQLKSMFGSTACKALYQCLDCKEPFDYFKCH